MKKFLAVVLVLIVVGSVFGIIQTFDNIMNKYSSEETMLACVLNEDRYRAAFGDVSNIEVVEISKIFNPQSGEFEDIVSYSFENEQGHECYGCMFLNHLHNLYVN